MKNVILKSKYTNWVQQHFWKKREKGLENAIYE